MHILNKKYILVILSSFSMVLPGCMVGPDFHTPGAPTTNRYTPCPVSTKTVSAKTSGNSGKVQYFVDGQDISASWWRVFHSHEINQLICLGLANSPNLVSAQAALKQAEDVLTAQVGSTLLPLVTGQFTGQRQRFTASSFGINGPGQTFNFFSTSVNISYTLDVFGGGRRGIEAQLAQVEYQNFQLEAAYLTLTSNIVTTAVTVASYNAQIQATHELIRSQAQELKIVKQQFELGGVSGADVLTQETELAQTQATLPPLEQNLAVAQHTLSILVGLLPSEIELPQLDLDRLDLPTCLPVSVPSLLVRQRPDIRAAEALLHAASAQIGVTTANMLPQFNLTGAYGWQTDTLSNLISPENLVWNITGQAMQTIFNGGALIARRRASIAAYQETAGKYRQTVLQGFKNVADTLRALENDAKALKAQRHAEISARNSLSLTQKQFRLGGINYISLLIAQRQYQQTRINRIQAQAARYSDTAALFAALGGGWWNRCCDPTKV